MLKLSFDLPFFLLGAPGGKKSASAFCGGPPAIPKVKADARPLCAFTFKKFYEKFLVDPRKNDGITMLKK